MNVPEDGDLRRNHERDDDEAGDYVDGVHRLKVCLLFVTNNNESQPVDYCWSERTRRRRRRERCSFQIPSTRSSVVRRRTVGVSSSNRTRTAAEERPSSATPPRC